MFYIRHPLKKGDGALSFIHSFSPSLPPSLPSSFLHSVPHSLPPSFPPFYQLLLLLIGPVSYYVSPDSMSSLHRFLSYEHSTDPTTSTSILKKALQKGYILHRDDKFLIFGPGGVGKTSLMALFINASLQLIRISTPIATDPLHLTLVRDVSSSRFTTDWKLVTHDRLSRMTALIIRQLSAKGGGREEGADRDSVSTSTAASPAQHPPTEHQIDKASNRKEAYFTSTDDERPNLTATPRDDSDVIDSLFAEFESNLCNLISESNGDQENLRAHSIHLVDSGGQPQFHEVLSIFLPCLSGCIAVFKLSETLCSRGEVTFYDTEGQLNNDPYDSTYSHEQVIRHSLLSLRSEATKSGAKEMPNIAFVGTHRDLQEACTESPAKKASKLRSIITELLPPEMQDCVITHGRSLGHAIFPINAKHPEKEDFEIARKLKEVLIVRSRVQLKKLPIKWRGLELVLHMMMENLHRKVLSREECEYVAHKLHFDLESFKAALLYLSQLNIIAYYEKLPSIIFGSCQVILDKITEIIHYCLQLKKGTLVATGMDRKLVNQGIVSRELLKSKTFPKHSEKQIFGPQELLTVLEDLLVIGKIDSDEYLMPCVLDISCIYPSPQAADGFTQESFILLFPKHCSMLGIFCAACSFLLRESGWRPLTEGGEVVKVARNSISFQMPEGGGGQVTLKDPLSSYFEVSVELPTHITGKHRAELYQRIQGTLLSAVEGAMKIHNRIVTAPQVSFLCPEKSDKCSSNVPHPATIDEAQTSLTCSQAPSKVSHPLTEKHRMWLVFRASPQPNPLGEQCNYYKYFICIYYVGILYSAYISTVFNFANFASLESFAKLIQQIF